jgi:hypothetical protein
LKKYKADWYRMAGMAGMAGIENAHDSCASKYFRSGYFQMLVQASKRDWRKLKKRWTWTPSRFRLAVSVKLPNRFTSMWCQVSQMEAELQKEREDCRD